MRSLLLSSMKSNILNKAIRTLVPLIGGYFIYSLCCDFFEKYYPTPPLDDTKVQGLVFLIEPIFEFFLLPISLLVFQYKVIVPRTFNTTKNAIKWTIIIGFSISLFFSLMDYYHHNTPFLEELINFMRGFFEFECFWLVDLSLIAVINILSKKIFFSSTIISPKAE